MTVSIARAIDPSQHYDVLIVGGGITGLATAYEMASTGLRVALVEKGDFGEATSSATGKLIHGGLRYLKNFEVRLVRESLAERRTLSVIAPGLVEPIPMVLPNPGWVERLGLTVYDLLAFDRNRIADPSRRIPGHRRMRREELESHDLGHLDSALLYHDAMMPNPGRLALAFARSAAAHGAQLQNHTKVQRLLVEGGQVVGAEVENLLDHERVELRARMVVNATGPWAHDLLATAPETASLAGDPPTVRSEGIYLVTRKLSDIMVLYVTERGHFSFAPWRGHTLIGPTETPYRGAVDDWQVTPEAVAAFLTRINATTHLQRPLLPEDVVATYGGLRPLVESSGEDTYGASRASECIDHATQGVSGIVTATGGKYTTSRAFAVKLRRIVDRHLGRKSPPSLTHATPLEGCDIGLVDEAIAEATSEHTDFSPITVAHLVRNYGTDHGAVLDLARREPALAQRLNDDGEILAQVVYAARHESAMTLADALLRRTGIGTLGDPGEDVLALTARAMASELHWSQSREERESRAARHGTMVPMGH